jgi:hypothetical protein
VVKGGVGSRFLEIQPKNVPFFSPSLCIPRRVIFILPTLSHSICTGICVFMFKGTVSCDLLLQVPVAQNAAEAQLWKKLAGSGQTKKDLWLKNSQTSLDGVCNCSNFNYLRYPGFPGPAFMNP